MKNKKPDSEATAHRERLKAAGLRCTTARIAVLERLTQARRPLSHADVADALVPEGYDRVTVFRNLVEFAEVGIASRVDLGDHVWRFELRGASEHHEADHPHFVCVDCGEVSCLSEINVSIKPSRGAKKSTSPVGQITEIVFKGHCAQCAAAC